MSPQEAKSQRQNCEEAVKGLSAMATGDGVGVLLAGVAAMACQGLRAVNRRLAALEAQSHAPVRFIPAPGHPGLFIVDPESQR